MNAAQAASYFSTPSTNLIPSNLSGLMISEHFADNFDRRYRTALAVVMVLVLGNQVLVQPYLVRLTTDAPLINVAGRQRMLSQRLTKTALVFDRETGERANAALEEMKQVLALWSASHDLLLHGDGGFAQTGRNSAAVRDGLAALEPHFVAMRDAARTMIESGASTRADAPGVRAGLATIIDHEAEYLRRMDRVVGLYEGEAQGRIETFRRIGWLLTCLTLVALLAIGVFVLRPATRLIRLQVGALALARDELEVRVSERTQELEAARERHRVLLEQFSHVARTSTVGEMASALAHELNQPLGAIANYAEGCLISLDAPEPALADVREALRRLLAATMRSGRIIEQVRRFVTRQGPRRETFDPNVVVNEAAEILIAEAEQRGVRVSLDTARALPQLCGDPVQIQQVLVNLTRNALEALVQSQTLKPELVISTRATDQSGVEFAVSDNGEGIPPEHLARVFDPYFSTRAGGMGMGLAISRTIVEAHHGRFVVESDPGVRTTFRFELPAPANQPDHERDDGLHSGR
jgi:two-component system, LuxR family, sensor kinase FixL